jgi:3-dehydroquinate dehydratase
MQLSSLPRPFICTSVAEEGLERSIQTIKTAEYEGASAFEVHLPLLGYPSEAELEQLTAATACPIYATCRRNNFYELLGVDDVVELSETERTDRLVAAVEAGLDGIDIELDAFDCQAGPSSFTESAIESYAEDPETGPAEISDDQNAIDQQRAVIDRVHRAGGDVVVSAHTYTHLSPAEALAIAERMTDRGADLCKIVGVDQTLTEGLETLEAHLRLNEADTAPYALMAIGDPGRIVRPISPMFGSAWVFAQPELVPGGFHSWPLVENAREILRRVDWRTVHTPHGRG